MQVINKQVIRAGYTFIGHFGIGEIKLELENCRLTIPPKKVSELLRMFRVECEDGFNFENLKDNYCRAEIDDNGNVVALYHITKDKPFYIVKERD